ncbi:hypothetical protein DYQ94_00255 [Xanthomonas sp. LMG 8993]|nr:hypothetical protein [Xanthomonas sp. LMG 8993]PPT19684.1 hypothetical protein XarCFBP6771_13125 [Xanthomonas arboricola]PPT59788.1 hypothetical protein XarbCFBP8153_04910 [Xanthomonas arboricola]PPT63916.1 hypothetical protein XarbCFBP8130_10730 [Xanthomonas arboricola]QWN01235.1 hypothetical protein DGN21_19530 [Xanthomonas sp. MLO165]
MIADSAREGEKLPTITWNWDRGHDGAGVGDGVAAGSAPTWSGPFARVRARRRHQAQQAGATQQHGRS